MNVVRTYSLRLDVTKEMSQVLLETISSYTSAYNLCCSTAYDHNLLTNGITLHNLLYTELRKSLPSQLAISVREQAISSIKTLKTQIKNAKKKGKVLQPKCPHSKQIGIRLDARSYTFWLDRKEVSILTCQGRVKIPFKTNQRFDNFSHLKRTSAIISYKPKKKRFYLHVQFEVFVPDAKPTGKKIGIDRGIKKLAVTSDNRFFIGSKTKRISRKYQVIKAKLQRRDTKSSKRHLCRLSGKEERFKTDMNHCIAKEIISEINPGDTIVLEDLSGIKTNRKKMGRKFRKAIQGWSYYQLEQFLIDKAEAKGIYIEYINPRYTSVRCSRCGYIKRSNRKNQTEFCCSKCGFTLNADLNASRNIVLKSFSLQAGEAGLEVKQPNVWRNANSSRTSHHL